LFASQPTTNLGYRSAGAMAPEFPYNKRYHIVRMFGGNNVWQNGSMKVLAKKVWQIDVHLSPCTAGSVSLDGFSLAKLCSFVKFTKPSPYQTFLLYSKLTLFRKLLF